MDIEGADILLDQPAGVFARRLAAESALTGPERTSLTMAFQELLSLHSEQLHQGTPVALAPEQPGDGA
jgi:hypothetical protein